MYMSSLAIRNTYPLRHILKDVHRQHQLTMSLFGDFDVKDPRLANNILWRVEESRNRTGFIIQSDVEPNLANVTSDSTRSNLELRTHDFGPRLEELLSREAVSYKIVANPARRLRETGRRTPILNPDAIEEWWTRRMEEIGLRTIGSDLMIDVEDTRKGARPRGNGLVSRIILNTAVIVGRASVEDALLLRQAVHGGVGREKSYGYGMLSLAAAGGLN